MIYILISCGYMLLFMNMQLSCKQVSDVVSTWAKFDGHIYHGYPAMQKYLPFIMYCELLLFTCKVNCLQTFEHMYAHWAIKVYVFRSFIHISTRVFEILRETRKTHFS